MLKWGREYEPREAWEIEWRRIKRRYVRRAIRNAITDWFRQWDFLAVLIWMVVIPTIASGVCLLFWLALASAEGLLR
jgi:hypothetical protein